MIKIYCDKCKKEIYDYYDVDLPCYSRATYYVLNLPMKRRKLCEDCLDKLKKWIDEE